MGPEGPFWYPTHQKSLIGQVLPTSYYQPATSYFFSFLLFLFKSALCARS